MHLISHKTSTWSQQFELTSLRDSISYGIWIKFTPTHLTIFRVITHSSLSSKYFLYLRSARMPLRASNTRFTFALGLITGLTSAYVRSSDRLTGYAKNDRQVAYYGALTPKEAALAEEFDSTPLGDFLDSSEQKFRA